MSVKVAIRVRPFNDREKKLKSELCVKMSGNTVILLDEEEKEAKKYNFDYAVWSHDGFVSDDNGFLKPKDALSKYWDQTKVYNTMGNDLLENAVQGYHCCLFAYGQTGSGKSYSIFGYGPNKGIVPIMCDRLFDGSKLVNDDKNQFSIAISMLEIYNEKIQDLLVDVNKRPKFGLKVHENPKLGVFVKGLNKLPVNSYEEIENVIDTGNKNKTIGSTLMNKTSSRSHTIIRMEVHQKEKGLIKTIEKFSCINLVDLAGSEKVSKTGATGDRLKEACSINKSLMNLGIVIKQLVKLQNGEKTIVSYRDSVLTRILQNALGGNSKTTMICAISPARDNFDETASTLRYANEAKRIKNNAVVNESEVDKMIRELQDENQRLKELLKQLQGTGVKPEQKEISNILDQIEELDEAIRVKTGISGENEEKKELTAKEKKAKKMVQMFKKQFNKEEVLKHPHIINLSEDMMQSGNIIYNFDEISTILVGRNIKVDEDNKKIETIDLNSVAISANHASIVYADGNLEIIISEENAANNTTVNGISMLEFWNGESYSKQLDDLDRIIFGTTSTYLVRLPAENGDCGPMVIEGSEITWDLCQMEKAEVVKAIEEEQKKVQEEELMQKESQYNEEIKQYQDMIKKLEEMMETKRETTIVSEDVNIVEMDEEGNITVKEAGFKKGDQITQEDIEYQKKAIVKKLEEKEVKFRHERERETRKKKQKQTFETFLKALEDKMINYYPQIVEANLIADFFNRRIEFTPFIAYMYTQNKNSTLEEIRQCFKVKVTNKELGYIYIWDLDTFDNRFSMIQESQEFFFQENAILYKGDENDPFWDPKGLIYYAEGVAKQKEIIHRFELKKNVILSSFEGEIGQIMIEVIPCDETGGEIDEDDLDEIDTPEDLIEKKMPAHFLIKFNTIKFSRESFLGLKFKMECEVFSDNGVEVLSTEEYTVSGMEMNLNFEKLVLISEVNGDIINHYMEKLLKLVISVENTEPIPKLGKMEPPVLKDKPKPTGIEAFNTRPSIIGKRLREPSKPLKPHEKRLTRNRKVSKKGGKDPKNNKDCRIF